MIECYFKGTWERWVCELSTLSRILFLRNLGLMDTGNHLAVSTTNGESNSFELKGDTCKTLCLRDKYGSNTKNEIKCWKSL